MKSRIITFVIMLCIVFSCSAINSYALGEEIALPAGLEFGMSVSEAIAASGYEKRSIKDTFFEAYFDECNYAFSHDAYLLGEATVGEIPASVYVFFDNSGLKQVRYSFKLDADSASEIHSNISSQYIYVGENLLSKYGGFLDTKIYKHAYMPVVDRPLYFSWFLSIFDGAYTKTTSESIQNAVHTMHVFSQSNGSSVYIDHYIEVRNDVQTHMLSYTYYDFGITQNSTTNSTVGF